MKPASSGTQGKLMGKRTAIAVLAAVAAVGAAVVWWASETDYLGRREVERTVRESLKDPDSARFKDVRSAGGGAVGCGTVNARNSMGGYVGDTPFLVWGDSFHTATEDNAAALTQCCRELLVAVKRHINSADVPNFGQCAGLVEPFSW